jgi:hypothetical protein
MLSRQSLRGNLRPCIFRTSLNRVARTETVLSLYFPLLRFPFFVIVVLAKPSLISWRAFFFFLLLCSTTYNSYPVGRLYSSRSSTEYEYISQSSVHVYHSHYTQLKLQHWYSIVDRVKEKRKISRS